MLDRQKMFDMAITHITKQGEPSLSDTAICKYRNTTGKKCVIGFFIRDEFYDLSLEGKGVKHEKVLSALEKSGYSVDNKEDIKFLDDMQDYLHDLSFISNVTSDNFVEKVLSQIPYFISKWDLEFKGCLSPKNKKIVLIPESQHGVLPANPVEKYTDNYHTSSNGVRWVRLDHISKELERAYKKLEVNQKKLDKLLETVSNS